MPEIVAPDKDEGKIGFGALREIQRKERDFTPIQPLPSDFYLQVALYFSALNSSISALGKERLENEFSAKLLHQKEIEASNAREVVKDIFARRLRKILVLSHESVFSAAIVDTNPFTAEEKEIFVSLRERLEAFSTKMTSRLLSSSITKGGAQAGFAFVKFVDSVAAFVGPDLKSYGPFSAGQVAQIPERNAEILVSAGSAVKEN